MRPILICLVLFSGWLAGCSSGVPRPEPDTSAVVKLLSLNQTIETPSFPANGGTRVEAGIHGYKSAVYVIGAVKDQVLTIQLSSDDPNVYFDVLEPKLAGSAKVFSSEAACRGARIKAPSKTTYVIRPFLTRQMADAGHFARYTLCINRCASDMGEGACRCSRGDESGI